MYLFIMLYVIIIQRSSTVLESDWDFMVGIWRVRLGNVGKKMKCGCCECLCEDILSVWAGQAG